MVARFNSIPGFRAYRVPLSGASAGFKGDIEVHTDCSVLGDFRVEVKARSAPTGWKQIADWLADNDMLVLMEDYKEPLVVMPWSMFEKLVEEKIRAAARGEGQGETSEARQQKGDLNGCIRATLGRQAFSSPCLGF